MNEYPTPTNFSQFITSSAKITLSINKVLLKHEDFIAIGDSNDDNTSSGMRKAKLEKILKLYFALKTGGRFL